MHYPTLTSSLECVLFKKGGRFKLVLTILLLLLKLYIMKVEITQKVHKILGTEECDTRVDKRKKGYRLQVYTEKSLTDQQYMELLQLPYVIKVWRVAPIRRVMPAIMILFSKPLRDIK